jgi:hypothetical protein
MPLCEHPFYCLHCREDAFQEYVELETVYMDCIDAAAQGSAHRYFISEEPISKCNE